MYAGSFAVFTNIKFHQPECSENPPMTTSSDHPAQASTEVAGKKRRRSRWGRMYLLLASIFAINVPQATESVVHLWRSEPSQTEIEWLIQQGANASQDLRTLRSRMQQGEITREEAFIEFLQIAGQVRTTLAHHDPNPEISRELRRIFDTYMSQTIQEGWEELVIVMIRRAYTNSEPGVDSLRIPDSAGAAR
jgi:hypothetical protein